MEKMSKERLAWFLRTARNREAREARLLALFLQRNAKMINAGQRKGK